MRQVLGCTHARAPAPPTERSRPSRDAKD
jgi:hypothetical protein